MTFSPSPLQQSIASHVLSPSPSNLIVNAVAGSGKTTTIVWLLDLLLKQPRSSLLPPSFLFLAFNKAIAETLSSRCPRGAQCSTFHSLGFRALKRLGHSPKVESRKVSKLLYNRLGKDDPDFQPILRLVSLLKAQWPTPETLDEVSTLASSQQLDFENPQASFRLALSLLQKSDSDLSSIDFDDMLRLPVLLNAPFDQQDWVFVDEAQDTNDIQLEILARLKKTPKIVGSTVIRPGTKQSTSLGDSNAYHVVELISKEPSTTFIFVGDPGQAIYGFRGANSDAMDKIAKRFGCVELPLSVSYRCPKAVVREAQKYCNK